MGFEGNKVLRLAARQFFGGKLRHGDGGRGEAFGVRGHDIRPTRRRSVLLRQVRMQFRLPVSHDIQAACRRVVQPVGSLLHLDRRRIAQRFERMVGSNPERGGVRLVPPGVERRRNAVAGGGQRKRQAGPGQGARYGDERRADRFRQSLRRGCADSQAGVRSRAARYGDRRQVRSRDVRIPQRVGDHRNQLRVMRPGAAQGQLGRNAPVAPRGDAARIGSCFESEDIQRITAWIITQGNVFY